MITRQLSAAQSRDDIQCKECEDILTVLAANLLFFCNNLAVLWISVHPPLRPLLFDKDVITTRTEITTDITFTYLLDKKFSGGAREGLEGATAPVESI